MADSGHDIAATIAERAKTHGDAEQTFGLAQLIKYEIGECERQRPDLGLAHVYAEAVDMIATKIARIVCGNPKEPDHWRGIEGYARIAREYAERQAKGAKP